MVVGSGVGLVSQLASCPLHLSAAPAASCLQQCHYITLKSDCCVLCWHVCPAVLHTLPPPPLLHLPTGQVHQQCGAACSASRWPARAGGVTWAGDKMVRQGLCVCNGCDGVVGEVGRDNDSCAHTATGCTTPVGRALVLTCCGVQVGCPAANHLTTATRHFSLFTPSFLRSILDSSPSMTWKIQLDNTSITEVRP